MKAIDFVSCVGRWINRMVRRNVTSRVVKSRKSALDGNVNISHIHVSILQMAYRFLPVDIPVLDMPIGRTSSAREIAVVIVSVANTHGIAHRSASDQRMWLRSKAGQACLENVFRTFVDGLQDENDHAALKERSRDLEEIEADLRSKLAKTRVLLGRAQKRAEEAEAELARTRKMLDELNVGKSSELRIPAPRKRPKDDLPN